MTFGEFASASGIAARTAKPVQPPRQISVSEAVCEHMKVGLPSGGDGPYSMEQTPYMAEPMDCIAHRVFEAVIFVGPAQSGKTLALIDGVLVWSVVESPGDCSVIQTNQRQAEDFSKFRLDRLIERCPKVKALLSPRPQDDNVFSKSFRNAMAIRLGWPSVAQVSGKAIRRMLLTDVDNFTGDLSIDELFGMARKRIQTFMSSGTVVAESSPARDYVDPIWTPRTLHEAPPAVGICSLYNGGDRRRWYWPCPECKQPFQAAPGIGGFVLPSFEELCDDLAKMDVLPIAEKFSKLVCPSCAVPLDHRWKRAMNNSAHWVGEGQTMHPDGSMSGERIRSNTASFWLGGVAAGYQSWVSLVSNYLDAVKTYAMTGNSKTLKTTTNVDQAMPYLPVAVRDEDRDVEKVKARAEDLPQRVVPQGVRFMVACVDVQAGAKPRFVVQVVGFGPGLQWYFVDRYALKSSQRPKGENDENGAPIFFPLDPAAYPEDWQRLIGEVMLKRYPLADESGRTMGVRLTVCDSGGKAGVTVQAYKFARWLTQNHPGLSERFRLLKGAASAQAKTAEIRFPDARGKKGSDSGAIGDLPVLFLNTDTIKDLVNANATRSVVGPGYMHFANWLSESWFEELFSEVRGPDGWENVYGRQNETLDLCVYAYGAAIALGADQFDWAKPRPWAMPWDENPEVRADGAAPAPVQKRVAPRRMTPSKYLGRP